MYPGQQQPPSFLNLQRPPQPGQVPPQPYPPYNAAPPPPPYSAGPVPYNAPPSHNTYPTPPPSFTGAPTQAYNAPSQSYGASAASHLPPVTRRKALLVGINYFKQRGELRGCINDVHNIRTLLSQSFGFPTTSDAMVILTDDQTHPDFIPTKRNIINAMRWLVSGSRPGDSLFFHFSGHGSQQRDTNGDEDDGYDETICPVDYARAGMISDDEMHDILVKHLPSGVRFMAVFDSCHSGTAMDLPYLYLPDGTMKVNNQKKKAGRMLMEAAKGYAKRGAVGAGMALFNGLQGFVKGDKATQVTQATRTTQCHAIMLSGCKDRQTSADAHIHGVGNTGAMSHALTKAIRSQPNMSYGQLLQAVRMILKNEYQQIPQFSSGQPIDMRLPFSI